MVDPIVSRRFPFHAGTEIRLADGRDWIFPAPLWDTLPRHSQPPQEYLALLDVILKTQDTADRYLSELALAIFLLGVNYDLSSDNYELLLTFAPESPDLKVWQAEFRRITEDHLDSFLRHNRPRPTDRREFVLRGWLSRTLSRFRSFLPIEQWCSGTQVLTPLGPSRTEALR